jgi:hypothetical protein
MRVPAIVTPATKPKPTQATENALPPRSAAARPVTPAVRPSRSPLSDTSLP